jgi:hypothetical protein
MLGHETITFLVGPGEKRYVVHKNLLTEQSEYFRMALNGDFIESHEQTLRFPEETPDCINLLIGWLYQDIIPAFCDPPSIFNSVESNGGLSQAFVDRTWENSGTSAPYGMTVEQTNYLNLFGGQGTGPLHEGFQSITTMPGYIRHSFEELRLCDYKNNRFTPGIATSASTPCLAQFPTTSGHIPGIPYCKSILESSNADEAHQIAVLRLCLFAETICWTALFNHAMTVYMQGERNLFHRALPAKHIELIYERAHEESPCRKYAADSTVSQIKIPGVTSKNIEMVEKCPGFLEDIFTSMQNTSAIENRDPKRMSFCVYHDHKTDNGLSQECKAALSKGKSLSKEQKDSSQDDNDPLEEPTSRLPVYNGLFARSSGLFPAPAQNITVMDWRPPPHVFGQKPVTTAPTAGAYPTQPRPSLFTPSQPNIFGQVMQPAPTASTLSGQPTTTANGSSSFTTRQPNPFGQVAQPSSTASSSSIQATTTPALNAVPNPPNLFRNLGSSSTAPASVPAATGSVIFGQNITATSTNTTVSPPSLFGQVVNPPCIAPNVWTQASNTTAANTIPSRPSLFANVGGQAAAPTPTATHPASSSAMTIPINPPSSQPTLFGQVRTSIFASSSQGSRATKPDDTPGSG